MDSASCPKPFEPERQRHAQPKIIVRKNGVNNKLDYYSMSMKDVMVTSYQTGGSGGEDLLTESVTLAFASLEVKYHAQNPKGRKTGESKFDHNLQGNASF
ncbi:type VI secretion system tube protein Hcp [Nocardioides sp. S-58]|uniref:Type VI secretion system tube protein Hcp n=1 Tax=Nocardioides renjunii TaxID=3095075 RepID=A0ABU5K952_9ACTN|nr:type VI secretion system tube protein Hcp [Nocardioides sp. S-58]MDZ5660985.1 type VI secretion system tube protein Hcp [Nocardioides sp. S-58]